MEIVSARDVTTGLLLILARTGYTTLDTSTQVFNRAVIELYKQAPTLAKEHGTRARFPVGLHILDTLALFDYTLQRALKKEVLRSTGDPKVLALHASPLLSRLFLAALPGGEALYQKLTTVFLDVYDPSRLAVR